MGREGNDFTEANKGNEEVEAGRTRKLLGHLVVVSKESVSS
jgi:hypothetical protein